MASKYEAQNNIVVQNAIAFDWEKDVLVYFSKKSDEDCSLVYPVKRKVPNAEFLAPSALQALIDGPTEEEKKQGFVSSVPQDVLVTAFEVRGATAYVTFNQSFSKATKNSCRNEALMSQIESTLKHNQGIKMVAISIK